MTPDLPNGPIAYLTGEYPRATDTFIQREVAGLREQGFKVETFSIRRTGDEHLVGAEQQTEAKSTFYVLEASFAPLKFLRAHFKAALTSPKRYFGALKLAAKTSAPGPKAMIYQLIYFSEAIVMAERLRNRGVVHLHNHIAKSSCTVAMLAAFVNEIPFSFTLHGPDIFFEPHRWRLDEKIKRAAFVACISDFCRSQAMLFSDQVHWSKLHIVHCGVEPSLYQKTGPIESRLQVTFVGRLAAVKGVPVLFDALTSIISGFPNLRVLLIGDGPERPALEALCDEIGLSKNVEFAGYRSQTEVAEALMTTDVFVLPSFAEGVPVVLMEAMAACVPVVTTRIAGVPELVEHGTSGILVGPGDPKKLSSALMSLLNDKEMRKIMGRAGRKRVCTDYNINLEANWLGRLLSSYSKSESVVGIRPDSSQRVEEE